MSKKFIENDYLGTVDVILYECEDGSMSDTITLVQDRYGQPPAGMKISMAAFDNIVRKLGYVKAEKAECPHNSVHVDYLLKR